MSIFENRFEHILYFRDTCDISCVEFMLYASVHSRFTAIWHYLDSVIGQRVEGEYTVGKLARTKKNIFKLFLINITQLVPYISIAGIFTTVFIFFWNIPIN